MEHSASSKSFLAIVVIFTIIAALLMPAPVYAAGPGHEPPPPKAPVNDLGQKTKADKASPGVANDAPEATPAGVASPGTASALASQLSVQVLEKSLSAPAKPVKFCRSSNPGFYGACTAYASVEEAINSLTSLEGNPSGVFYVAVNYPKPSILQGPAIVIDQDTFHNPDRAADLDMQGGYIFSGKGAGTQGSQPTELFRPVNILNINANSSFSMENFDFNIWALIDDKLSPSYDPADIHITDSHNVRLSDLTITSDATAWSGVIGIENSENVHLTGVTIQQNSIGPGIVINQSYNVWLKDISINNWFNDDGIAIYDSGLRANADNPDRHKATWDPSISLDNVVVDAYGSGNGAGVFNSDHVSIKNSTFNVHLGNSTSAYPDYAGVGTYSSEYISLDNVSAFGNDRGDGLYISDTYNTLLNNVNANSSVSNGALITWGGGTIAVTNSHFDGNGGDGLHVQRIAGNLTLNDVTCNGNALYGFAGFTPESMNIINSQFNENGYGGLIAAGGEYVGLSGVNADHNGGFGAGVYNGGAFLSLAALFYTNFEEISNMWLSPQTGNIKIGDSTFSDNNGWGLQAVILPLPGYVFSDADLPSPDNIAKGSTISLHNVEANNNGDFGISASITSAYSQLDNINLIRLNNVTASNNWSSGVLLSANTIHVLDGAFMDNGGYGLELTGDSRLVDVKACNNGSGSELHDGNLLAENFDDLVCPEDEGWGPEPGAGAPTPAGRGGAEPEAPGMPWQVINVYMDPGKNTGTLSCQFGTTFLYLEKMGAPTADFEWGRVELSPCIVPGGTVGTFTGLGQSTLPGALPDGVTFQGKAFDFALTGTGGSPVALGGPMNVRFTLPAGFSLPAGKKLAIQWFDPSTSKWVELTTYAGGAYANAYTTNTGAFVLTIK